MAKARKKQVTKTLLNKLLKESAFDPKQHQLFKIILEEHGSDPIYLENRAIEFIREAQLFRRQGYNDWDVYHEKMQKAVCLIVMARAVEIL